MKHKTTYYVFRYNLRSEAAVEYRKWLAERSGAKIEQEGWTYAGTFFDILGFGRYDYETRWELNDHGSVRSRPLDTETERRPRERLPFIEDGQVGMMQAQGSYASAGR